MKKVALLLVAAAAFFPASPAGADDFAFRARPSGLASLEEVARSMLPQEIGIEEFEHQILGCPGDKAIVARIADGLLEAQLVGLDLQARSGALRASVLLDLGASAEVTVDNFYACFGSMTCDVSASATPIAATLEIALGTSADGWIEVLDVDVDLALTPGQFDVTISGCTVGSALSFILNAFDGWALERLRPRAEALAAGRIADRIADTISEALPRRLERGGLAIETILSRLDIDPDLGLTVEGEAAVTWQGLEHKDAPKTARPEGEPLPARFGVGGFEVAASDRLVTRTIHQAWQAGLLEMALADLAPTIPLSEDGLAQKLGLPAGTQIDVAIRLGAAPEVSFARDGGDIAIRLRKLQAELAVASPGGAPSPLAASADAFLRADFTVGRTGGLILRPLELEVTRLEIESGAGTLAADPARLAAFLADVGVPMLAARLKDLPLAPALRPTDGLFVWMRRLQAEGGWLRASLDLLVPDPNDTTPPSTLLLDPPRVVPAGMTRIQVTGEDDTTPTPLLRYVAWLDGAPLLEEPAFLEAIPVSAADGAYLLEVAAVDLRGNVDPTPSQHHLTVDGVPPVLEILEAPASTARGDAYAAWRASDDRGVVTSQWELRELEPGGAVGEVVRQGTAGEAGEVRLEDLPGGRLFVLRITAIDEAGNRTSEEFGFLFSRGGCSAGGGASPTSPLLLAGLLVLLGRRRWRDRRRPTTETGAC